MIEKIDALFDFVALSLIFKEPVSCILIRLLSKPAVAPLIPIPSFLLIDNIFPFFFVFIRFFIRAVEQDIELFMMEAGFSFSFLYGQSFLITEITGKKWKAAIRS